MKPIKCCYPNATSGHGCDLALKRVGKIFKFSAHGGLTDLLDYTFSCSYACQ